MHVRGLGQLRKGPARRPRAAARECRGSALWVAAALVPLPAAALDVNWQSGSGNWSTPSNWLPGAIPNDGADVVVASNDATSRTITYDFADAPLLLNTLSLDNTGGGTNTLLQTGNVL